MKRKTTSVGKRFRFGLPRPKFASRVYRAFPLYAKLLILAVLLLGTVIFSLQYRHHQLYTVTAASRQLVSASSVDTSKVTATTKAISYDSSTQKTAGKETVTIAGPTDSTGKTTYQATINTDFTKGLSFGDSASDLSFQMVPQFGASKGIYKDGQIMFPASASTKIFQTYKQNGLKEDIVLTKAPGRTATWKWTLNLGDKLAAKMLPDGSVGIFAANPNLYGNLQIQDAKSQALVDKAKTTNKDYQIFTIPAPYIKNAKGQTLREDVSYRLAGNTLTLQALNLTNQHYPISIDPSIVVTTTADFATNYSDDGTVDYRTANQIQRGAISLGSVGSTSQQTNAFTTARYAHTSVAYNGYLYVIGGGDGGTLFNDIQHCPINSNGSVGTCVQQTSAFTTARWGHTSVAYNGYLYVIGGGGSGGDQNDIQHCPINSDGSVGTCVQQTSAFTTARSNHTSVAYNGYLYIIGGTSGTNQNDIQHCPINSDGSVGTCVQQTSAFTTARWSHTSVAYNGYLYVIGGIATANAAGCNASWYCNDIQHCPINADGSVGTCVQQTSAFTTARYQHTSVAYNGYLYVIGGYSGSYQNDIQHCPINADGSIGTCVQQTSAFTTARYQHTSVAYNGYLYVIGGYNGSLQNDIQHLLISTGSPTGYGAVGATTQQTSAFTTARSEHTSVAYNGYLYIIGGWSGSGYLNDIQHCPINADGSIGTCVQQTSAFTTARGYHTSVAYNGYLYVIGGNSGSYQNDIQHCPINSDGSVGTCVQQTSAFTTARGRHTSVAYNGYLYVIGGYNGSYQNDIQHCPINSDGSIGTCVQQASAFTTARLGHTSVAYNGYLYLIGGNSGARQNDIQHCPINADGSIGTCVQQTSAFTTARDGHTSVAYNGYLYVIGGFSGAAYQNDIQHLPILSLEQKASYERTIDIGGLGIIQSVSFNGLAVCGERLSYRTAGSNGVYGSTTSLGGVIPATSYTINAVSQRYIWLKFTLDDTNCGTTSTITDITLTYNRYPAVPTLTLPTAAQTGVSVLPEFRLVSTDPDSDNLQYKIEVCSTSNCSSIVRTIDQTSSQTGWLYQGQVGATSYVSGVSGVHTYQAAGLSASTQYWWRGYAIDPGGTNAFTAASSISTFTTGAAPPQNTVRIGGGNVNIGGNVIFKP